MCEDVLHGVGCTYLLFRVRGRGLFLFKYLWWA